MWNTVKYLIQDFNERKPDERTKDWFMVEGPWSVAMVLAVYLWFCVNCKKFMEKRPAMELKKAMMVYNLVLVLVSAYTVYECLAVAYLSGYSMVCEPVDFSNSPLALRMARVIWIYYITKFVEMLDTVFFVFRKKFCQVTFLHVYHHLTMPINGWLGVKYVGGGQVFMICAGNSTIHVVMYLYYLLSALGPEVRKHLWWKKYLTTMQLMQFVIIFTHSLINFCVECDFPDWINIMSIFYMVSQFLLFLNFYKQTYLKRKKNVAKSD